MGRPSRFGVAVTPTFLDEGVRSNVHVCIWYSVSRRDCDNVRGSAIARSSILFTEDKILCRVLDAT